MKNILLLLILFTGLVSWGQSPEYLYHDNGDVKFKVWRDGNHKVTKRETYQKQNQGGKLQKVENYKNRQKHGVFQYYNSKGIKIEEKNFVNGKLHGTSKLWDDDGRIVSNQEYEDGELIIEPVPIPENPFLKVEEKVINGKKVYKIVAGFDDTDLLLRMLSMSGSIIKDPSKGIKFLNDNGLEYKVGTKGLATEGKFCVKLTEKNLRTLETYGKGGFCGGSADKAKCINTLIETIKNDEYLSQSMDTWNGCEFGWNK